MFKNKLAILQNKFIRSAEYENYFIIFFSGGNTMKLSRISKAKANSANQGVQFPLMQCATEYVRRFQKLSGSVVCGLVAYCINCYHALVQGVWLPPLPVYWNELGKCDWQIWLEDDAILATVFHHELLKQLRLREIASFSTEHENLFWEFVKYGEGERKPVRPLWFG